MPKRNTGPRLQWFADRGAFYIVWTERHRSRKRSTGETDSERAQVKLAEFIAAKRRAAGPRNPDEALVTDILTDYLQERGPKVVAKERMSYAVLALCGYFEGKTVADIDADKYTAWRNRGAGTVRRELGVLRAAVNHAHKKGRLTAAPSLELPEAPPPKERWLTRVEVARLIRAAKTPQARLYLPLFILLGVYTGRRKKAILSLRWCDIDFAENTIDFGRSGTKKRRGKIPIPDRLLPHLVRARRRGTELGFVLHEHGKRIDDIKKGFAAAVARAGLSGVTPHTLKHTAVTWRMQAGVPLWEAAGFFATSEATLLKVYGHHHPDYMKSAANMVRKRCASGGVS
jgi:integrase